MITYMKQEKHFIVDVLFVLALFAVFTVSALALVYIGADVYQHTVQDMSTNYETRTSVSYVTEKIRKCDSILSNGESSVRLSTLSGAPAIELVQEVDGVLYSTYLYLYDGYLKELFMRKDASLGGNELDAGENIMPLKSFSVTADTSRLLSISMVTADDSVKNILISTHCNAFSN